MSENQIAKKQNTGLTMADRFTNKVIEMYTDVAKGIQITEKEKSLIAGYFIKCNEALKQQGFNWNEIDLNALALDLAHKSRLGLDMQVKNHLFPIPFKNKKTGKVTLNLITGVEGEKHKRLKFAAEKPVDMRVELIYSTDKFIPQKTGQGDTYSLEITNPFDRGEIVGGIGYIQYEDSRKNVLIMMSKADILKRKPPYARDEFWVKWKEKMYEKTIMKELCNHIAIDADKVAEYRNVMEYEEKREVEVAKEQADVVIADNANNGDVIDITDEQDNTDKVIAELGDTPDILKQEKL
jgi:recombination protein RecT